MCVDLAPADLVACMTPIDPSGTFGPGTPSRDRAVRAGPLRDLDCPPVSSAIDARRRSGGPPDCVLSDPCLHAFPSLCRGGAQGRGCEPRRVQSDSHEATGLWGDAIDRLASPAVKTSNPGLPPRDALCAVGGIRAWGEIPAAGPARLRLYSHLERLHAWSSKTLARTFRGDRRTPRSADDAGRTPTASASPDRRQLGDIGGLDRLYPGRGVTFAAREYGVKHGRRRHSGAGQATCSSSPVRRCGHRTRRDPRGGRRLCVGHRVDYQPRRAARGRTYLCFNTRSARIARQRWGRRTTAAAAPLRAAGWNSELAGSPGKGGVAGPAVIAADRRATRSTSVTRA
jgi:hypothetical protein